MSELQKIKDKLLQARKSKDKDTLKRCQTLIADLEKDAMDNSEEITDKIVHDKISKYINNNDKNIPLLNDERKDYLIEENKLLKSFLPKEMTQSELESVIEKSGIDSIKDGMIFLSSNHSGEYNKGMASSVIKNFLSKK